MAEISQLKLDSEKEGNGVWVPFDLDVELLIAGSGSPEFRSACSELLKPHRQKIRTVGIEFEERIEIIKPAIAAHLLKGWKNLTSKGKPVPYSKEKALELINEIKGMATFVLGSADEREWFRKESQRGSGKNLLTASDGS